MVDHHLLKRMTPFLVLEILKNHTDGTHGLKVSQIVELLQEDYGVTAERKAVSRILNDLFELTEIPSEYSWKRPMPYTIKFDTKPRSSGDIRENWRLYKTFEDVEVRLLMDAVQSVQGYPTDRVLEKLQQLGSPSMRKGSNRQPTGGQVSRAMPYSMDAISRAIQTEKKLAFHDSDGDHVVSPYRMVLRNGIYYLICYHHGKEDMAIFRIDRMSNAEMLDAPAKDYHAVSSMSKWNYSLEAYVEQVVSEV